jgi:hypothetical protein
MRQVWRLGLLCLALVVACGDGTEPEAPSPPLSSVASVSVTAPATTIRIGEVLALRAAALDGEGQPVDGVSFTWSANPSGLVTVGADGTVVGVSEGAVTVTAMGGGKTGSLTVTVGPVQVASVVVSPDAATVLVDATRALTATVRSSQGVPLANRPVTWATLDPSQASVTSNGVVQGLSPGSARIVAASEGQADTALVTVEPAGTMESGILPGSATWTPAGSPYRLSGDVRLNYGDTLTIEPGATVLGNGFRLLIYGRLAAVGTAAAPIRLRDMHVVPKRTDLSNITELYEVVLEHVDMTGGSLFRADQADRSGALTLRDSRVTDLTVVGEIRYPLAPVTIERTVFRRIIGFLLYVSSDAPVTFRNNVFVQMTPSNFDPLFVALITPGSTLVFERNSVLQTDRVFIRLANPQGFSATQNYWGTTNEQTIQSMIHDQSDDSALGAVPYNPFLAAPDPATPLP